MTVRLLTLFDYVYEAELDHQISSIPRILKYMTDSQICRKLQVTLGCLFTGKEAQFPWRKLVQALPYPIKV